MYTILIGTWKCRETQFPICAHTAIIAPPRGSLNNNECLLYLVASHTCFRHHLFRMCKIDQRSTASYFLRVLTTMEVEKLPCVSWDKQEEVSQSSF